jgi:hypothetical protein
MNSRPSFETHRFAMLLRMRPVFAEVTCGELMDQHPQLIIRRDASPLQ